MSDLRPSRKMSAAGLGGAAATALVFALTALTGLAVPAAVGVAIGTLATFGFGWVVSED